MPGPITTVGRTLSHVEGGVSLSEILSAMTFALDLTEGAEPGHALRSCLLGMRIAEAMGVPQAMRASLYYALLLKDIGCSSNASRMTEVVGGDDRAAKYVAKMCDWTKPYKADVRTMQGLWKAVLPNENAARRVFRFAKLALSQHKNNRQMIELRCERGADIVRMLGISEEAAEAVRALDEHWDGSGYPERLRGEEIPLLARICLAAQNLDVFAGDGVEAAMRVLRKRSGTWFDPSLVRVAEALHGAGALWDGARRNDDVDETRRAVMALDPGLWMRLEPERVDRICEAFASVVDAKSPFTYRHSMRVSDIAVQIAVELGLDAERISLVRRAALLHDLGKLRVPNTILDKRGDLTEAEWAIVLEHPKLTRSILERVSLFREIAVVAGEHHEKMDGSGYPLGLMGEALSLESRLLAVADCYTALAEERPYREAIAPEAILGMLGMSVPHRLDGACFAALSRVVGRWKRQEMKVAKKPVRGVVEEIDAWRRPGV